MERPEESARTNEPLMRPLEALEQRAYPAEGDGEPQGSIRDKDESLPDTSLATDQRSPLTVPQNFGDGPRG